MASVSNRSLNRSRDPSVRVIPEHDVVRIIKDVRVEGYSIAKDTVGTVVGIYGGGAAYAVEITDLSGGPEGVTLRANQVEPLLTAIPL